MTKVLCHVFDSGSINAGCVILLYGSRFLDPANGVEYAATGNDFGLESVSDSFNLRLSCRRGDTSLVGATPADEVSEVSEVGCLGVAIIKIAA